MIIVVATVRVKPEKRAAYEACCRDFMAKVRDEETRTIFYEVGKPREGGDTYTVIEIYPDDATMQTHIQSKHVAAAMPTLMDCLAAPPDMTFHDVADTAVPVRAKNMFVVVATVPVRADKVKEYEAVTRDLVGQTRANEPGMLFYTNAKSREGANAYIAIEVCKDEAAWHTHAEAPHFKAALAQIIPCLAGQIVMRQHDTI